jgi:hypothetical protein
MQGPHAFGVIAVVSTIPVVAVVSLLALHRASSTTAPMNTEQRAATTRPSAPVYAFPLKLDPSGQLLTDQRERPFFINGDTAWSLIAQLTIEEAALYLSTRHRQGYNLALVSLIEHRFATKAPANAQGHLPFAGSRAFAVPNEAYFDHADAVIREAERKGIVVLLAPLYLGSNCGDEGWCAEVKAASVDDLRAWGRYVGERYKTFPNILWLIGGDDDPRTHGVSERVRAVVTGLREVDTVHVMTAHNHSGQSARDVWDGESWLSLNAVYEYKNVPAKTRAEYTRHPSMPLFLLESYYEHEYGLSAELLRAQAYGAVFSGATAGHIFGNCPVWHFGSTPEWCNDVNWKRQLDSPGSRTLAYVGRLLQSRAFFDLVPEDNHIVVPKGSQFRKTRAIAARTRDGATVLVYVPARRNVTVDLRRVSGISTRAWWFNPRTAEALPAGEFPTMGSRSFDPPSAGDWVMVLDNAALNLPAPGSVAAGLVDRRSEGARADAYR